MKDNIKPPRNLKNSWLSLPLPGSSILYAARSGVRRSSCQGTYRSLLHICHDHPRPDADMQERVYRIFVEHGAHHLHMILNQCDWTTVRLAFAKHPRHNVIRSILIRTQNYSRNDPNVRAVLLDIVTRFPEYTEAAGIEVLDLFAVADDDPV